MSNLMLYFTIFVAAPVAFFLRESQTSPRYRVEIPV